MNSTYTCTILSFFWNIMHCGSVYIHLYKPNHSWAGTGISCNANNTFSCHISLLTKIFKWRINLINYRGKVCKFYTVLHLCYYTTHILTRVMERWSLYPIISLLCLQFSCLTWWLNVALLSFSSGSTRELFCCFLSLDKLVEPDARSWSVSKLVFTDPCNTTWSLHC